MQFKRLIAFGDSFTFGHGLPDCQAMDGIGPGDKASKLGYVSELANNLNIKEVLNFASPGASNRFICTSILNFPEFKPDDLILIQFTYHERDYYWNEDGQSQFVGSWNFDKDPYGKYFANRTFKEAFQRSYEAMLLSILYLKKQQGFTFGFITPSPDGLDYSISTTDKTILDEETVVKNTKHNKFMTNSIDTVKSFLNIQDIYTKASLFHFSNKDFAPDNLHWGLVSNKYFAQILTDKIDKKRTILH